MPPGGSSFEPELRGDRRNRRGSRNGFQPLRRSHPPGVAELCEPSFLVPVSCCSSWEYLSGVAWEPAEGEPCAGLGQLKRAANASIALVGDGGKKRSLVKRSARPGESQ